MVLLAVDCIGWLFCVSKRRNSTEPRDRWGLWSLAGNGSVCPIPCHLTPWPGHRTTTRFKRQPAAPIHAHHSIAKDSDHNAGNGERRRHQHSRSGVPTVRFSFSATRVARRSNREFAWCVPSLHKATHTRTQSRKKGGERRSGEKEPRGGKKTQGRKKPRGGNTSKENARSCSRHPPCLIPTGRWPESRRPEPGGAGPLGRM